MVLSLILLLLLIALSWARLVRPGDNRLRGTTILIQPIPLLGRIRMHAAPVLLTVAVAAGLAVAGRLSWWLVLLPVVSGMALIALRVRYTLTDAGIRFAWTGFRRWTEFVGVRRAPGGARLQGVQKARGMHIWLSGSRGDDEFLHFLRQTLRNAYKGTSAVIPFPASRAGEEAPGPGGSAVSAYVSRR